MILGHLFESVDVQDKTLPKERKSIPEKNDSDDTQSGTKHRHMQDNRNK
jgi:hypothetical protein